MKTSESVGNPHLQFYESPLNAQRTNLLDPHANKSWDSLNATAYKLRREENKDVFDAFWFVKRSWCERCLLWYVFVECWCDVLRRCVEVLSAMNWVFGDFGICGILFSNPMFFSQFAKLLWDHFHFVVEKYINTSLVNINTNTQTHHHININTQTLEEYWLVPTSTELIIARRFWSKTLRFQQALHLPIQFLWLKADR